MDKRNSIQRSNQIPRHLLLSTDTVSEADFTEPVVTAETAAETFAEVYGLGEIRTTIIRFHASQSPGLRAAVAQQSFHRAVPFLSLVVSTTTPLLPVEQSGPDVEQQSLQRSRK